MNDNTLFPKENIEGINNIISEIANFIIKKKMETPAILFLELNKPLALFYGSMVHVSTPFLGAIFDADKMNKLGVIMSDRKNVELLICKLEELAKEKEADNG